MVLASFVLNLGLLIYSCFVLPNVLLVFIMDPVYHCNHLVGEDEAVCLRFFVTCVLMSWFIFSWRDLYGMLGCVILASPEHLLCYNTYLLHAYTSTSTEV